MTLSANHDPYVCAACGAHYPAARNAGSPPEACAICSDERQYVPLGGQRWLTYAELVAGHENSLSEKEPGLWGFGLDPSFAIGQRALLVRTPDGNLLWDCLAALTPEGTEQLEKLGGVRAIAISHPHYYTAVKEFAEAFDARVFLHAADRQHVTNPSERIEFWEGERLEPFGGLTLIRAGGHYAGGTVLHWPQGADGRGALLTGDILQVIPDRDFVAFMYSYPNLIPLPVAEVERIGAAVEPFDFDRIYGAWWGRVIPSGAKDVVRRSVERYRRAIAGRLDGVELPPP